ncbi:hypothetical protein T4C_1865 [Trichinella pseudospiralis]|uniref:Uncharacterized protein n=1 Tax=Trichinella pseudospiralis TaxID=6337 RepID=A0A0V1JKK6_TRIPS|nr:hypothetical protein T4C_1865 [Trichinella pseudospiralis]
MAKKVHEMVDLNINRYSTVYADKGRIALDGRVEAALECKHLVFAIELEWSLEIQVTDLEVLFSLPMASKGTTRDLMLVNTWLEVNVPPVSTTLGSQLQRSDIPQVTTANVIAFLTKYSYVISPLPDSVAADVGDFPELFRIACYETSKRRLLRRYRESDDDCFMELMIPVAVADMKRC